MRKMLLAVACAAGLGFAGYAQTSPAKAASLEIVADSSERLPNGDTVLTGNIVVVMNGVHMAADYALYRSNRSAFEFGNNAVRIGPADGYKVTTFNIRIGPQHARPTRQ